MKKTSSRRLLFRMGIRSLRQGIAQFLSIIAIGGIAVTLFVGLLANAESFASRVETVYSEGNLPDLWVTTKSYDKEDEANLRSFLDEGDELEGRGYFTANLDSKSVYCAIVPEMPSIDRPYGTLELDPSSTETDFLYVDADLKATGAASTGSTFALGQEAKISLPLSTFGSSLDASLLDRFVKEGGENVFQNEDLVLTAKVTGFMHYPENITRSAYNTSTMLISDSMLQKSFQSMLDANFEPLAHGMIYNLLRVALHWNGKNAEHWTNPNQWLIAVKDESKVSALKAKIQSYFDAKAKEDQNLYMLTDRETMPFYLTISADVTQARQFTFVFPAVFFLVAILVVLTTLSQRILRERTQIGTMKALGISKGDIHLHYISLTLMLVGLGTLIGEIVGPLLIPLSLATNIVFFIPCLRCPTSSPWGKASSPPCFSSASPPS